MDDECYWPYKVEATRSTSLHFSPRTTVAFISIISIISCTLDKVTKVEKEYTAFAAAQQHLNSMRQMLLLFFQLASWLLLLAAVAEWSLLVQVYVWYSLSFVVLALGLSLAEFLMSFTQRGAVIALMLFVPEVAFLFVLFRCLPLVNKYGREIEGA